MNEQDVSHVKVPVSDEWTFDEEFVVSKVSLAHRKGTSLVFKTHEDALLAAKIALNNTISRLEAKLVYLKAIRSNA